MNNRDHSVDRPKALVTGASSGIGLELAKLLARDGCDLIIVAQDKARLLRVSAALERTYKVKVTVLVMDLAEEGAASSIHAQLKLRKLVPHVLVNSAGFGDWGEFEHTELLRAQEMIRVNVTALTSLTRLVGADMIRAGGGRILNVASEAAFLPGPLMAVYYATKAYVLSFSVALAEEWSDHSVSVTALCPGPVASRFEKTAKAHKSALFQGKVARPRDVAIIGYRGMKSGKAVVVPTLASKMQVAVLRFIPRKVAAKAAAHAQRRLY